MALKFLQNGIFLAIAACLKPMQSPCACARLAPRPEQLLEVLGLGVVALLLLLCGELGALTPDTTQICGARAVQAYDLLYILYYAHVAMRLRRTRARTLSL